MRLGSLFSGIGGLELGVGLALAKLGVIASVVWQVEQDEFCRSVLARHWPDADRSVTDVRKAGRSTLGHVDIICGGFPCQDVSTAGKRAGIHGPRSGLWFEYVRVVRELRPRFVVVENVAALLGELGDILGPVAELGYDAVWTCVRASDVGAPHYRNRIFLLAYSDREPFREPEECVPRSSESPDAVAGGSGVADPHGPRWDRGPERVGEGSPVDGEAMAYSNGRRWPTRVSAGREEVQEPHLCDSGDQGAEAEPGLGRAPYGPSGGLDAHRWPAGRGEHRYPWEPPRAIDGRARGPHHRERLKALGNAVVPQQAAKALLDLFRAAPVALDLLSGKAPE